MKIKELKDLSAIELDAKLREIREKLFRTRIRNQSGSLKNPLEIRNLRRDIARILMILNQHKQSKMEDKK